MQVALAKQAIYLVNPRAGAGRCLQLWNQQAWARAADFTFVSENFNTSHWVQHCLKSGKRHFIAVGGDGTLHHLLNALVQVCASLKMPLSQLTMGAQPYGSSNDFYKPKTPTGLRDIGVYKNLVSGETRYFINNASLGITAEANGLFNDPDRLLRLLKENWVSAAIICSALRTFFSYRNTPLRLRFNDTSWQAYAMSNLGVVKNPHFSGSMHYPREIEANDGKLAIYVCHNMNRRNYLSTLVQLHRGKFNLSKKTFSEIVSSLEIASPKELAIELDGEIYKGKRAHFSVLKEKIKICTGS